VAVMADRNHHQETYNSNSLIICIILIAICDEGQSYAQTSKDCGQSDTNKRKELFVNGQGGKWMSENHVLGLVATSNTPKAELVNGGSRKLWDYCCYFQIEKEIPAPTKLCRTPTHLGIHFLALEMSM
jgi:hypothetical protein